MLYYDIFLFLQHTREVLLLLYFDYYDSIYVGKKINTFQIFFLFSLLLSVLFYFSRLAILKKIDLTLSNNVYFYFLRGCLDFIESTLLIFIRIKKQINK
jgi:hypothetical protein